MPIAKLTEKEEVKTKACEKNAMIAICYDYSSWMHIISMLWSMADAVSSGSCPILFKVLTLNENAVSSKQRSSRYCYMDALRGH